MQTQEGIIYQSLSGFYYVWSEGQTYTTKPKGLFRYTQEKPLVGDKVIFEFDPADQQSESRIQEILPRQNELIRPKIANVDHAFVVVSLSEPSFSYQLLDYFLVWLEAHHIQASIVLSKWDIFQAEEGPNRSQERINEIQAVYAPAHYPIQLFANDLETAQAIGELIHPGINVVIGQSGVGKSTLLNFLLPQAAIKTGEISNALNRGKHTTREVTLYPFRSGLLADSPGFSALDLSQLDQLELRHYFPEISEWGLNCQFRSCVHLNEPKCQVKAAVQAGDIAESRYRSYLQILERIRERKTY